MKVKRSESEIIQNMDLKELYILHFIFVILILLSKQMVLPNQGVPTTTWFRQECSVLYPAHSEVQRHRFGQEGRTWCIVKFIQVPQF